MFHDNMVQVQIFAVTQMFASEISENYLFVKPISSYFVNQILVAIRFHELAIKRVACSSGLSWHNCNTWVCMHSLNIEACGLFYKYGLTLIPAWISNYMLGKV